MSTFDVSQANRDSRDGGGFSSPFSHAFSSISKRKEALSVVVVAAVSTSIVER